MPIPEKLRRFPTKAAIESLAARFNLPDHPGMQDWEWEVADSSRIDEFLAVYESGELNDDERFTLMETILQSFAESYTNLENDSRWTQVIAYLEHSAELHLYTLWYWADIEDEEMTDPWNVRPYMRKILAQYRNRTKAF